VFYDGAILRPPTPPVNRSRRLAGGRIPATTADHPRKTLNREFGNQSLFICESCRFAVLLKGLPAMKC